MKKTSPTTFEMEAENFYPPWGRELEILILNKQVTEGMLSVDDLPVGLGANGAWAIYPPLSDPAS